MSNSNTFNNSLSNNSFVLNNFISGFITHRLEPLTFSDITACTQTLRLAVEGKSVLVIGGAGSIGLSFISQLLPFRPASLTVVDTSENGLAELARTLRSNEKLSACVPDEFLLYPMDFASPTFEKMFKAYKRRTSHDSNNLAEKIDKHTVGNDSVSSSSSNSVMVGDVASNAANVIGRSGSSAGFDIVANFSAHKHVRSEKDIFSIEALLRNNLLNARRLLDLLAEYPPESYFCVSTDKAANPVNIMGASKRIMEDVIFSYSDRFPVKTARFANVAFSNGSLLDGFLKRLDKLQPLSAPSDIKRYFVSPEESGQICLLAAILGQNREIFFPKLEEAQMMSFDEIARELLKNKGYTVRECSSDEEAIRLSADLRSGSKEYPVHFSHSDTSGEKSFEEFFTAEEQTDMNRFKSLGVITGKSIPDKNKINTLFSNLERAFARDTNTSKEEIVDILKEYLPNFEHIETGKSLDNKM